ncbi:GNAT family N-acetyltransferase [Nocardioides bruguierae]|uniref:Bifunctional helix-turn-helix transcriptional regulator/GNAT family N-acetyltransferase n=1 Tax=Nocardioides bruguierae TaxID=2945102 RepID=A0A9X2D6T7_9ACTN|nr:GNAT family N-acetyltransferase [Nocardioides bruguierae]MCM0620428.1 bifunctional helix-turn-helix transcriptional regulator/GNAT family N-acetyltransferase [Nocardioides bruguierae]
MQDDVATLRRFNLAWSQRTGVLEHSFLGLGRPLAASRLLLEVGSSPDGASVLDLRTRLGLDSGYLSRLLRRLEREGLVLTEPDPADQRRRVASLTEDGRRELREIDRRSDALASSLLMPLTESQRARLAEALRTAELLVRAATLEIGEHPHDDPRVLAAVGRYVDEVADRFSDLDGGFNSPGALVDPGGRYLLALSDGVVVGVGGIRPTPMPDGSVAAEVKRMWVDPSWRGSGLGRRLLEALEQLAASDGHPAVVLDTNRVLGEALSLYTRTGYVEVPRYNDNPHADAWFRKALSPAAG